jgi:hypothetical protein
MTSCTANRSPYKRHPNTRTPRRIDQYCGAFGVEILNSAWHIRMHCIHWLGREKQSNGESEGVTVQTWPGGVLEESFGLLLADGHAILRRGNSALLAVERTICVMEDSGISSMGACIR